MAPGGVADGSEWIADARRGDAEAGAGEREASRFSWYNNPPEVPPGAYVAIDYVAERLEGLRLECGYLALRRVAPGRYGIVRTETNRLMRSASSTDASEAAFRAQYCRGG